MRGPDLVVGEPHVSDRLEHRPVDLLAPDDLGEELEQRLAWIGSLEQALGQVHGLAHPLDQDRRDQSLLGGEVPEQRAPAHAGPLGDLAYANVEPALAEQLPGSVEHAPAVSLGIGTESPFPWRHRYRFSYAAAGEGASSRSMFSRSRRRTVAARITPPAASITAAAVNAT